MSTCLCTGATQKICYVYGKRMSYSAIGNIQIIKLNVKWRSKPSFPINIFYHPVMGTGWHTSETSKMWRGFQLFIWSPWTRWWRTPHYKWAIVRGPDRWARAPLIPPQWDREDGTPCDCQMETQALIVSTDKRRWWPHDQLSKVQAFSLAFSDIAISSPGVGKPHYNLAKVEVWLSTRPLLALYNHSFPSDVCLEYTDNCFISWTLSWSFGEREQASVWTFAGQCLSKCRVYRSSALRIPRSQASLPSLLMFIFYIMSRNFSLL